MNGKLFKTSFGKVISFIITTLVTIILTFGILQVTTTKFDVTSFNSDNAFKHIEELASSKYEGRLAGTEGNMQALKYIEAYFKEIGIETAGENKTYYQNFRSMVPVSNSKPVLNIIDNNGKIIKKYTMGKDYREVLQGFGGSGVVKGKLKLIDKEINKYSSEEIKDKIILTAKTPSNDEINYAINSGAKAIFSIGPESMPKEPIVLSRKEGQTIMIDLFSYSEFKNLAKYASNSYSAYVKLDCTYKMLNTPNIVGKIKGKSDKEYLIISANIDSTGSEYDGRYFPGALNNASGVGVMMEIARTIKTQRIIPEKTIIFIGWNNSQGGTLGSKYYVKNPIYPLDKTQVLVLSALGGADIKEMVFDSAGNMGSMMRYKMNKYAVESKMYTRETSSGEGGDHAPFIQKGVPSVYIYGNMTNVWGGYANDEIIYTVNDNISAVSKQNIQRDASILLNYIKYEVYKDVLSGLFSKGQIMIVLLFIYGMYFIYIINFFNRFNSDIKIFGINIENIYYSTPFALIEKLYYYVTPVIVVFLSLVFIASAPPDFNLIFDKGKIYTNFPTNLVIKDSIKYTVNLLTHGLGDSAKGFKVINIVGYSFVKSISLIVSAIVISLLVGISKGIFDGYKERDKGSLRTVATIATLSLPDVFVVVLAQMLTAFITQQPLLNSLPGINSVKNFLIPVFCLSIIPTVYISRIVSTTVKDEVKKEYIKAARAKGLSNFYIIKDYLLIGVFIKVMDALSSVFTMLISNLIVIEYLFGYSGIAYNLFSYYGDRDISTFMGLAMALGLMYVVFNLLFKFIAKMVNPLAREGVL